jgi:hypothetical protein
VTAFSSIQILLHSKFSRSILFALPLAAQIGKMSELKPGHGHGLSPGPIVRVSVQKRRYHIVDGQLEGLPPFNLAVGNFVAHVKSRPAFHEDMKELHLTPGTSLASLTQCNGTVLTQKRLIADDETPLTAAKAVAGEGVQIEKIDILIEASDETPSSGQAVASNAPLPLSDGESPQLRSGFPRSFS